jgi:hypothetical protein
VREARGGVVRRRDPAESDFRLGCLAGELRLGAAWAQVAVAGRHAGRQRGDNGSRRSGHRHWRAHFLPERVVKGAHLRDWGDNSEPASPSEDDGGNGNHERRTLQLVSSGERSTFVGCEVHGEVPLLARAGVALCLTSRKTHVEPDMAGSRALGFQRRGQKQTGFFPVATDGSVGNGQSLTDFHFSHPREVTHLHDADEARVDFLQSLQRGVHLKDFLFTTGLDESLGDWHMLDVPTPSLGGPATGEVHDDRPHGPCRVRHEVVAVVHQHPACLLQAKVELVNEPPRVEQRLRPAARQPGARQAAERLVQLLEKALQGRILSGLGALDKLGDVAHSGQSIATRYFWQHRPAGVVSAFARKLRLEPIWPSG